MNEPIAISRRAFIGGASAAATAALLGLDTGLAPSTARAAERLVPIDKIGIQLFTLRTLFEQDVPGTLRLLADIGYRNVEVAGLFGYSAEAFRSLLDSNGLRAVGGHQLVGPALIPFFGERSVESALDEAVVLGQEWIGTAGITIPTGIVENVGEAQTASRYHELAALANSWGAAAAGRGLRLYIHTHYWEYGTDPVTGESLFQILLDETDPSLVSFEMDIFWIVFGGVDPLRWLSGNEERFPLLHIKDGIPNLEGGYFDPGFTDLGEGVIDYRRIIGSLRDRDAHHYIVERDDQPHPASTARKSYAYLASLRTPGDVDFYPLHALLLELNGTGRMPDHVAEQLFDRLRRASGDIDLGREKRPIGYLEQLVAKARNQIRRDTAARDAIVAEATRLIAALRAVDGAEGR
jgi:sugar phosphate isomerase/epimerase